MTRTCLLIAVIAIATVRSAFAVPETGTARRDAFPADLGVTESEVVAALVPDYAALVCSLEAEDFLSDDAIVKAGSVEEWVETDFGLEGKSFLFVSVVGLRGICAQCSFQRIAVFQLPRKEIVFRFEHEGNAPAPDLGVFPLFPDDRVLCLSFATGEINLNMGGYHAFRREWYWPRPNPGRGLEFEKVWSGTYDYGTTDNMSWLSESACAVMALKRKLGRYERLVRSF
jgi:hypothetical protein